MVLKATEDFLTLVTSNSYEMKTSNNAAMRERILLEFLSAYDHDGIQRIYFCAGAKQSDQKTDEE